MLESAQYGYFYMQAGASAYLDAPFVPVKDIMAWWGVNIQIASCLDCLHC